MSRPKPKPRWIQRAWRVAENNQRRIRDGHGWLVGYLGLCSMIYPDATVAEILAHHRDVVASKRARRATTRYHRRTRP